MIKRIFRRILSLTGPAPAIWLPASALMLLCMATNSHALSQTRQDIEELQRNMFIMQSEISDLKALVKKMPSAEDMQQIRRAQADMTTQIQELLKAVQVLTGRFEESRYFTDKNMKQSQAEIDTLKARVDSSSGLSREELRELVTRIETLESGLVSLAKKIEELDKTGKLSGGGKTGSSDSAKKETPEDLYEEALNTFKKNDYRKAREMMESLIKKYPGDSLAGNAQFWIAETYYSEKSYTDAILAYEDLLQKYKGHNKIPAALLKQAYSFLELGDEKASRGILKELVANYPDSEQAKTAKEKLSALEGSGTKKSPEPQGPPSKPTSAGNGTKQ